MSRIQQGFIILTYLKKILERHLLLRNSGMCAVGKDKLDIDNMLIHTSLNSFDFCACIAGDEEGKGQGRQ